MKHKPLRFRNIFLFIGILIVLLAMFLSDPFAGIDVSSQYGFTIGEVVGVAKSLIYILVLHLGRKALLDYMDLREHIVRASGTPEGSGMVVIGVGLMMISIALVVQAATR